MKTAINRTEAKKIEEPPTDTPTATAVPVKLLPPPEATTVVSEPEAPTFVERTSDCARWGINE